MTLTIYHNPKCSTARNVLAALREAGHEPTVVDYQKTPLSATQIQALVAKMGGSARDMVRSKEPLFKEMDLGAASVTDAQLIAAMAAHPILINRPICETDHFAMMVRPSATVTTFLERLKP
jgi:arsenate reductase (glutaredoxin)